MKTSGNSSAKGQNLDPCSSSISCEELMLRDMSSKDSYKNSRAKSTSSMYGGKGLLYRAVGTRWLGVVAATPIF